MYSKNTFKWISALLILSSWLYSLYIYRRVKYSKKALLLLPLIMVLMLSGCDQPLKKNIYIENNDLQQQDILNQAKNHLRTLQDTKKKISEKIFLNINEVELSSQSVSLDCYADRCIPLLQSDDGQALIAGIKGKGRFAALNTNIISKIATTKTKYHMNINVYRQLYNDTLTLKTPKGDRPLFINLMKWLLKNKQNATVVLSYFSITDDEQHKLQDLFKNITIKKCNNINELSACIQGANLIIVGSEPDKSAILNRSAILNIKDIYDNALRSGTSLFYINQNNSSYSSLSEAVVDIMGANIEFNKSITIKWNKNSKQPLEKDITFLQHFIKNDFKIDWSACRGINYKSDLKTQFFNIANKIKKTLNSLDRRGVSLLKDSDNKLLKSYIMLGDKYRKNIHYPVQNPADLCATTLSTEDKNNFLQQFLRAAFADRVVYYTRDDNLAQPDLGDFSDKLSDDLPTESVEKTFILTGKPSQYTGTGLYALPGRTITITRPDSGDNVTKPVFIFFNSQETGTTRDLEKDHYTRPKFVQSPHIIIPKDHPVTLSTPYGGTIMLEYPKATGTIKIKFDSVYTYPFLSDVSDLGAQQKFFRELKSNPVNWVGIKTDFVEIHSLKKYFIESINSDAFSNFNVFSDRVEEMVDNIWTYMIKGAYELAGFAGTNLELAQGVAGMCKTLGWDCTDKIIHASPKIQQITMDLHSQAGRRNSGNPYDQGWSPIPFGWEESYEMGHNLQQNSFNIYGSKLIKSFDNIFPAYKYWQVYNKKPPNQKYKDDIGSSCLRTHESTKSAYDIIKEAASDSDPTQYVYDHIWQGEHDAERLAFYIQIAALAQDILAQDQPDNDHIGNGWQIFTLLYLHNRLLDHAKKEDLSKLGMDGLEMEAAKDLSGNDYMLLILSFLLKRDLRPFFQLWGITFSNDIDTILDGRPYSKVDKIVYFIKDCSSIKNFGKLDPAKNHIWMPDSVTRTVSVKLNKKDNDVSKITGNNIEILEGVNPILSAGIVDAGVFKDITDKVAWSSDNDTVATIDKGIITPHATGQTTISIRLNDITKTYNLTVYAASSIGKMEIKADQPNFYELGKHKLTAILTYKNGLTLDISNKVKWSSNNTEVATIEEDGNVILHKYGSATIHATFGNVNGTFELTITEYKRRIEELLNQIKTHLTTQIEIYKPIFTGINKIEYTGKNSNLFECLSEYCLSLIQSDKQHTFVIAGTKDEGRFAAFHVNIIHKLNYKDKDYTLVGFDRIYFNLMKWLLKNKQNAVVALNHFSLNTTETTWLKSSLNNSTHLTVRECSDDINLRTCIQDANLIITGSDHNIKEPNISRLKTIYGDAIHSGTSLLYINNDHNSWDYSDLSAATLDIMGAYPIYRGNFYKQGTVDWNNNGYQTQPAYRLLSQKIEFMQKLIDKNFSLDCTAKNKKLNYESKLNNEIFPIINSVKTQLNFFDRKALSLFKGSYKYKELSKLYVMLGDEYRKTIHYPVQNPLDLCDDSTKPSASDKNKGFLTFLQVAFADRLVYYTRDDNLAQSDLGDFSDKLSDDLPTESVEKTFTLTGKPSHYTGTGLYALPGRKITITRDSGDTVTKPAFIFFNPQRTKTTRDLEKNSYTRPKFVQSPHIIIPKDHPVTLSTPYGGTIMLEYPQATGTIKIKFDSVYHYPFISDISNLDAQAEFFNELKSSPINWAGIKTDFVEIHSLKKYLIESINSDAFSNSNTFSDKVKEMMHSIWTYMIKGVYEMAGFADTGLELAPEVKKKCDTLGWDCTDKTIHKGPKIQQINIDIHSVIGGATAGNPYDQSWPIDPFGWGESHEVGHNLQKNHFNIYKEQSRESSNNIFPAHKQWQVYNESNQKYKDDIGSSCLRTHGSTKSAYDIIKQAASDSNPTQYVYEHIWEPTQYVYEHVMWQQGSHDAERLAFYIQIAALAQDILAQDKPDNNHIGNGWQIFTLLYLHNRLLDHAKKEDLSKLGMDGLEVNAARNLSGNDYMLLILSFLLQRDLRPFFQLWGIMFSNDINTILDGRHYPKVDKIFYFIKDCSSIKNFGKLDPAKNYIWMPDSVTRTVSVKLNKKDNDGSKITGNNIDIVKGVNRILSARIVDAGVFKDITDKVTWSSSDHIVATIDKGIITPHATGKTTIQMKANDVSKEFNLTVYDTVIDKLEIRANKSNKSKFDKFEKPKLTAILIYKNGLLTQDVSNKVKWSSTNTDVATIEKDGNVILRKYGTVTIKATFDKITSTFDLNIEESTAEELLNHIKKHLTTQNEIYKSIFTGINKIKYTGKNSNLFECYSEGCVSLIQGNKQHTFVIAGTKDEGRFAAFHVNIIRKLNYKDEDYTLVGFDRIYFNLMKWLLKNKQNAVVALNHFSLNKTETTWLKSSLNNSTNLTFRECSDDNLRTCIQDANLIITGSDRSIEEPDISRLKTIYGDAIHSGTSLLYINNDHNSWDYSHLSAATLDIMGAYPIYRGNFYKQDTVDWNNNDYQTQPAYRLLFQKIELIQQFINKSLSPEWSPCISVSGQLNYQLKLDTEINPIINSIKNKLKPGKNLLSLFKDSDDELLKLYVLLGGAYRKTIHYPVQNPSDLCADSTKPSESDKKNGFLTYLQAAFADLVKDYN